ncbi:MAG: SurA N-terminal domain-containing protein [Verrucomicrobiota bacterium]|jgi:hypothetical protein
MTNTFRKHHKTIMWIIIVGTIVSFVYFLSPTARNSGSMGVSRPAISHGSINGESITQQQFDGAMREARLLYRFYQGHWPMVKEEESQAMTNTAYQRLFIQGELKQMNLEVTPEAEARYTRAMFGVPEGTPFPQEKFNDFVKRDLNQEGHVALDDFDRFVQGEVGQQLLKSLFGMTGELISQKEAEFFFRRDNETMDVELVRLPLTNYEAKVTFTPQEIADYYTNHQAAYRLPEREQVNYIRFDVTNYVGLASNILAGMTNLDAQIEMNYESADPASFKDEAGAPLTPEAAKAKIKESFKKQVAAKAAQTNVTDLTTRLFEGHSKEKPVSKEDMQSLAATNGLTVVTTEPFDAQNPPPDLALAPKAVAFLFQLEIGDPTDQYQILPGTNGFYLVGLEKKYPSEDQPLESVRAKVTEDYRAEKAMELIKVAGANIESAVKNGLARGQSFEAICAAQGVKVETLTPFAAVTTSIPEMTDKQEFEYLVRIVYELPAGQSSPFAPTPSGGFLAYVKSRTPVEEAIVQRDIPTFLERFRKQRQDAAYQEWMMREFEAHVVMGQHPAG